MLEFSDAPYQFFPARPSRLVMGLSRQVNRWFALPRHRHQVADLRIHGGEEVRELARKKARLLFVANHSTHSDAQVMTEIQRRLGVRSCFMAAYDVFLRHPLQGWIMQRNGAFSVDREGSDSRAMKAALDILKSGSFALTVFPEGNVYLTNDRVTPFLDGASFIAMKAQKDLGMENPVYLVPVSIKLTHLTDVRNSVREILAQLARDTGAEDCMSSGDVLGELVQVGRSLLTRKLRHRGILPRGATLCAESITTDLLESAEKIVTSLEDKIEIDARPGDTLTDRVRKIRSVIHQIRTDDGRIGDHAAAAIWADEAILAIRVLSYATGYAAEHPTVDRFAETTEKMREDHYSRLYPPLGPRRALIEVGKPLSLGSLMESEGGGRKKGMVSELSRVFENAVQSGLDRLQEINTDLGAEWFDKPPPACVGSAPPAESASTSENAAQQ